MVGSSEASIVCTDVSKSFRRRNIFQSVEFSIKKGVTILAGENGSGKSTLFYILNGTMKPDSGSVSIFGLDPWGSHEAAMKEVSFMLERPSVLGSSSIREHIYWFSAIKGATEENIKDYMHLFGVEYTLSSSFHALSMGEVQLVMLSCYLSCDTPVFMLDEPNSHIDVHKRSIISEAIRDKTRASNSLFLVSTHVFDELLSAADRMLILRKGQLSGADETSGRRASILRTSDNTVLMAQLKEDFPDTSISGGAIFTSAGIEKCVKAASENSISVFSYFSIPEELRSVYE
ncbi:MAG: ABC transporter ATP-binding protein [Candidatus Thermoplasmatota archaeon]|jgi:ABC-2 type transport system ATP-binding protein|nr:ABC transporter ATP-binding protein [Candidatus Thermoplasmatota archaeon]MCL5794706.1 ABC transporter ATP-binding protein [Candidatus Thermoplasmatota archaeon]